MNYWLHRISHHAEISYPLLERNILSIGFSDFANVDFIDKILTAGASEQDRWNTFEQEVKDTWGDTPRTRHNLWRFVDGFKKGDRIIVPGSGIFSIYELLGERPQPVSQIDLEGLKTWNGEGVLLSNNLLSTRSSGTIDLGLFWVVKVLYKNISRYDFADADLTSRMKIRTTNANIWDLKESIERAIVAFEKNKPINIYSSLVETVAPNILLLLKKELNPDKLELLVKWYFIKIGASEVFIPSKNAAEKEGDADVIATFETLKLIIYCQVKFHNGQTDEWAVKQILDYINNEESKNAQEVNAMDDEYSKISWVITSGDHFSEKSLNIAKQEKIQLINGLKFSHMLLDAGIIDLDRAF